VGHIGVPIKGGGKKIGRDEEEIFLLKKERVKAQRTGNWVTEEKRSELGSARGGSIVERGAVKEKRVAARELDFMTTVIIPKKRGGKWKKALWRVEIVKRHNLEKRRIRRREI